MSNLLDWLLVYCTCQWHWLTDWLTGIWSRQRSMTNNLLNWGSGPSERFKRKTNLKRNDICCHSSRVLKITNCAYYLEFQLTKNLWKNGSNMRRHSDKHQLQKQQQQRRYSQFFWLKIFEKLTDKNRQLVRAISLMAMCKMKFSIKQIRCRPWRYFVFVYCRKHSFEIVIFRKTWTKTDDIHKRKNEKKATQECVASSFSSVFNGAMCKFCWLLPHHLIK